VLPPDLAYQALMLMIMLIIATFGAISLSMHLPAVYAFEVPLLLLIAASMISRGTLVHILIGVAMPVALGAMLVYSRNSNETLGAAIAANLKARGLVDELVVQKDAAEKANVAKTRFLASASHDLRQPMHTIGLLVDILRDRVSRSEDRQLVERIHGAVLAMENLFKGLLDISKLDAGAVEPNVSAFALAELFDVIKLSFASQAESKGLQLRIVPTRAVITSDR
jgi:signal transduction histidine kinase